MTGYERVNDGSKYNFADSCSFYSDKELNCPLDEKRYENANYYSNEMVAKSNARADKLMRQLRRFAVENRKQELDWSPGNNQKKYYIYSFKTAYETCELAIYSCNITRDVGAVYFDAIETAELAIEQFYDELVWYFTEYRDSCGLPEQEREEQPDIQRFSTDELLEELKRRTEQE